MFLEESPEVRGEELTIVINRLLGDMTDYPDWVWFPGFGTWTRDDSGKYVRNMNYPFNPPSRAL